MKHFRPILVAAAALAFVISACSQPEDLQTPTLAPQFGTADRDVSVDVALAPENGTYVLSEQSGRPADQRYDLYEKTLLRRYNASGSQIWVRDVASESSGADYPVRLETRSVKSDSQGKAYILYGRMGIYNDSAIAASYNVAVYDVNGQLEQSFPVGRVIYDFIEPSDPDEVETFPAMTVGPDQDGSIYVAVRHATVGIGGSPFSFDNLIRKYSFKGELLWERILSVGVPTGIAAASDGTIYISGHNGLARYNGVSTLLWKKSGFYNGVAASGSSVFVNTKNTVYRFSSAGQQQGSSFMGGLNSAIIQDLSGDGAGSVLVSGKYAAGTGNWNAFVRKLNASGSSLWTSTYGTPVYDDAQGVVSVNGREAYVTGTTLGSLAHMNRGEEDGYVRKLGVGGQPLWTR